MIIATCSDFARHRFLFTILPILVAIAGFIILLTVHHTPSLEYAGLFLVAMGAYSAMPVIVCWFNMNLGGHHRRSIGSAWQVGFGNIGGIIATYAFISTDAPYYTKGYAISLAFLCLSAVSCCAYAVAVTVENRKRDRLVGDGGLTELEKRELGVSFPLAPIALWDRRKENANASTGLESGLQISLVSDICRQTETGLQKYFDFIIPQQLDNAYLDDFIHAKRTFHCVKWRGQFTIQVGIVGLFMALFVV